MGQVGKKSALKEQELRKKHGVASSLRKSVLHHQEHGAGRAWGTVGGAAGTGSESRVSATAPRGGVFPFL